MTKEAYDHGTHNLKLALDYYRSQSREASLHVKADVEGLFHQAYQSIRMISHLSSVRTIDRHAKTLGDNDRNSIQEIYNNLKNNVDVSEIYILPREFNPEVIDVVTGHAEMPIISFDDLIERRQEAAAETEIFEYRLMVEQMKWFALHYPALDRIDAAHVPSLVGREVITCDNSAFSAEKPRDADRSGIVYSAPFYGPDGKFKGQVSAVFLTQALRHRLPEGRFVLVNKVTHQKIFFDDAAADALRDSFSWVEKGAPDPALFYSEAFPLSVRDQWGEWVLWVGAPSAEFLQSDYRASVVREWFLECALALLLTAFVIFFLFFARRYYQRERYALIKERERAEAVNTEKSEFLSSVISHAVDGLITIDEAGIVQIFNPACERIFGYTAQEVIGRNLKMLMPEPYHSGHDGYLKHYRDTGETKIIGSGRDVSGRHKDGTEFPLELSVSETKLNGKRMFIGIVRDISERKSVQEQLQTYMLEMEWFRAEAEKATRLKSEFLAIMSHEIRTPMNGVMGMTGLLLETRLDSQQEHYAKTAMRSAQALLEIINDILDFSKIEAGRMELEPLPMDLRALAEDLHALFSAKAAEKKLELRLVYAVDLPRFVRGDIGRIRQILTNLLSNALKFTEKGYVELRVAGTVQDGEALMKISVKDTGIGIHQNVQEKLFDKFTQADASTTRKYGGTGLGLAICKQLAALMKGAVGIDSAPGEGSTFWFTMALPVVDKKDIALPVEQKTGNADRLRGLKVLLVEDNLINQEFALETLRSFGCQVTLAVNGREGVECVEGKERYDIILMDCQMPEMDGYKATRRICGHFREHPGLRAPVIALTANAMKGDREKCLKAGMNDCLTKPFLKDQLGAMLMKWVTGISAAQVAEPPQAGKEQDITAISAGAIESVKNLMGGRYAEIVRKFIGNTDKALEKIEQLLRDKKNPAGIALEAHSLKSSSGYLGAVQVTQAARALEDAARGAADQRQYAMEDLMPAFKSLKNAWQQARAFYEGEASS